MYLCVSGVCTLVCNVVTEQVSRHDRKRYRLRSVIERRRLAFCSSRTLRARGFGFRHPPAPSLESNAALKLYGYGTHFTTHSHTTAQTHTARSNANAEQPENAYSNHTRNPYMCTGYDAHNRHDESLLSDRRQGKRPTI